MTTLRNIYIAGAAKAGTTALYYLLNQHPEICTPVVKEPNYFNNLDYDHDVVKPGCGPGDEATVWTDTLAEYEALYSIKERHLYKLDASVSYLYSQTAARQIACYDPEATIIIVLRNPVDRAWSHYRHLVRDGRESRSFEEALDLETERIDRGWEFSWHLKHMGLYSEQVQRYFDHFDQNRICLFLFEDLKKDINSLVDHITQTAGLSSFHYQLEDEKQNASGVSRSPWLARMVNTMLRYKTSINKIIPPAVTHSLMEGFRSINTKQGDFQLSHETKRELEQYFRSDIEQTSRIIGRDLSFWLT